MSKENIRALVAGAGLYSCDVEDGHRFWANMGLDFVWWGGGRGMGQEGPV